VPVAANRFTAAGTGARRGGFTIYRDLLTAADAFARRGKPKLPAAVKHSVVVCYHLVLEMDYNWRPGEKRKNGFSEWLVGATGPGSGHPFFHLCRLRTVRWWPFDKFEGTEHITGV